MKQNAEDKANCESSQWTSGHNQNEKFEGNGEDFLLAKNMHQLRTSERQQPISSTHIDILNENQL
jgi:hypothetical protein